MAATTAGMAGPHRAARSGHFGRLGAATYSALVTTIVAMLLVVIILVTAWGTLLDRLTAVAYSVTSLFLPALILLFWGLLFLLLRRRAPASVGWVGMWWRGALASIGTAVAFAIGGVVVDSVLSGSVAVGLNGAGSAVILLYFFVSLGVPLWVGLVTALPLRFAACGVNSWPRMSGVEAPATGDTAPATGDTTP